jgi:hypothetical protein
VVAEAPGGHAAMPREAGIWYTIPAGFRLASGYNASFGTVGFGRGARCGKREAEASGFSVGRGNMFTKHIPVAVVLAMSLLVMPASVLADCPGDMNNDNVVDLADAETFLGCMLGPAVPVVTGCEPADIDLDGDADMSDFGELQVAFGNQCGPQEIVLRDSIGSDNSMTDENKPIGGNYDFMPEWLLTTVRVSAPQSLELTTLSMVVSQQNGTPLNLSGYDYRVSIWDSESALESSPTAGNILTLVLDTPTSGPTPFGQSAWGYQNWWMEFDVSTASVTFDAGDPIIVGIQGLTVGSWNGTMGILESDEPGESDQGCSSALPMTECVDLFDHPWRLHYGRVGISIKGVSN